MFHTSKFLAIITLLVPLRAYEPDDINLSHYKPEQTGYEDTYDYHRYDTEDEDENPTSARPLKENGWKPIIGGRTPAPVDYKSQALQKLRERYLEYLSKSETTTTQRTRPNRNAVKTTIRDYNVNTQMYVGDRLNHTHEPTETYRLKYHEPKVEKKPKMLNEDDIMWMHYGEQSYRKPDLTTPSEEKSAWLDHGLQYFLNRRDKSDKTPKNIYEIIDKNNRDEFKPLTQRRGSHWDYETGPNRKSDNFDRLIKNSESGDDQWLDLYKAIYGPDGNSEHDDVKYKTQTIGGFVRNHNVEPPQAFSRESKSAEQIEIITEKPSWWTEATDRNVKYLGKPIVITEPTPQTHLTAEYYRKLFDSFGNHDDYKVNANKKLLPDHPADSTPHNYTTNREPESYPIEPKQSNITAPDCSKNERKNRNVDSRNSTKPDTENIFKIIGIDVKDFLPKTLRTNILLVKNLLVECYADYDKDNDGYAIACFKKITAKILDKAIASDVIKLTDTVSLIKENSTELTSSSRSSTEQGHVDWLPNVIEKTMQLFSTHSLKVQLVNPQENNNFQVEGRRRHYRRVFPIMVGAYMILSTVLIPLGFKFMTLLGTKSLLVSKLSLIIALMGTVKKIFGIGTDLALQSHYSSLYPTAAYPPFYPSYYDPWRRDEYRKISHYDEPNEYSHYSEEVE